MTITQLNPALAFPPSAPAVTTIDDFVGANGDPVSTSIWDTNGNTGHGVVSEIQSNSLHIATGTAGGYTSNDCVGIRTDATYSDAEIQFLDFEWLAASVDQELSIKLGIRGSSNFPAYMPSSVTCVYLELDCYAKTMRLWKVEAESYTALGPGTVSFTSAVGANPSAGTKWNIALRHTGTTLDAYVWLASGSRPGTPTISVAETTFTSAGKVSIGANNTAVASRAFRVGQVARAA